MATSKPVTDPGPLVNVTAMEDGLYGLLDTADKVGNQQERKADSRGALPNIKRAFGSRL